MKKLLFIGIFVVSIVSVFFSYSTVSLNANSLLLSNIEAFASGDDKEIPTEITTCVKDEDVRADDSKPTNFTLCNSATTSTLIYFCGGTKKGYKVGFYEYSCKIKK